jgi:hypothetical protein
LYYRDPAGYYPDVQTCPSGWLQVGHYLAVELFLPGGSIVALLFWT